MNKTFRLKNGEISFKEDKILISDNAKTAKVYLSGEVKRKLTIQGLLLTKGARAAIEAAGGKVVEV